MEHLTGETGQLVDRFMDIVRNGVATEGSWYDLGLFTAMVIGGSPLGVIPDDGREPRPGSVAEHMHATGNVVSGDEFFSLVRARIIDRIEDGVNEAFIVRALRDQLRRNLMHLADVGTGDERRVQMRERIEGMLGEP